MGSSVSEHNEALAKAVGLHDLKRVTKLVVTISTDHAPTLEVTRLLVDDDEVGVVREVLSQFKFAPQEGG